MLLVLFKQKLGRSSQRTGKGYIMRQSEGDVDLCKKDADGNFEKSITNKDSNDNYVNEKCPE